VNRFVILDAPVSIGSAKTIDPFMFSVSFRLIYARKCDYSTSNALTPGLVSITKKLQKYKSISIYICAQMNFDYMETQAEIELRLIRECHSEMSSQLKEITKQLQILNEELKIMNEAIKSYQNSQTSIGFTDYNAE
jgi:hypothetical protein